MKSTGLILLPLLAFLAPTAAIGGIDYQSEIRPILNSKCFKCHSGPRAKGKLRMDSPTNFARRIGGDDPVIVPGNPATSLLTIKAGLPRSDGDAMPPPPARARGAEAMTSVELNLVKQWIAEGASFEEGGAASTPEPATSEAPAPAMTTEMLSWTNLEGNSLQAFFVSSDGTNVTLKKEDGSTFQYPLSKLNAESQALAAKLAGQ